MFFNKVIAGHLISRELFIKFFLFLKGNFGRNYFGGRGRLMTDDKYKFWPILLFFIFQHFRLPTFLCFSTSLTLNLSANSPFFLSSYLPLHLPTFTHFHIFAFLTFYLLYFLNLQFF